ncbi:MAG: winged helix-turn-helix transcriptional regulator [Candidatus Korarchaeota archaeon]|nr:winged helix-turn-helix transcriptional regulator [Candidatus Korarchaeota archaeon]
MRKMKAEDIIEALSGETKRKIISVIARRPLNLKELAEILGITPPAVLKQVRELEELGIIESFSIKEGAGRPRKYYRISRSMRLVITLTEDSLQMKALEIKPSQILIERDVREKLNEIRIRLESLSEINSFSETILTSSSIIKDIDHLLSEIEDIEAQLLWMREEILRRLKKLSK